MKSAPGLRLKCGLKVETFVSAKFCLKSIFTKGDLASPRLSNNHSGFLCHVTFLFYSNYTIGGIYPSFNVFYLRKSAVLKWKTLLPHIYKLPKDCFGEVFCIIILSLQPFQILKWRKVYGGHI